VARFARNPSVRLGRARRDAIGHQPTRRMRLSPGPQIAAQTKKMAHKPAAARAVNASARRLTTTLTAVVNLTRDLIHTKITKYK
jgi:hypothetical protein